MKTTPKPQDLDSIMEKLIATQKEPDEFKKRDMLIGLLGGGGLNLIDESKHQQKKRYLP